MEDAYSSYWQHFDLQTSDKLLWILISFHVAHFGLLWLSWKCENVQIGIFLCLGVMMLNAERLNELLAQQQWIAHTNYFDSSGMFFTCAVAIPVVVNLICIIFLWIRNAGNVLVDLKRKQLREKMQKLKSEEKAKSEEQKKTD